MNQATCALIAQVLPVFLVLIAVRNGFVGSALARTRLPGADTLTRLSGRDWTPRILPVTAIAWAALSEVLVVIGGGRPQGLASPATGEHWLYWGIANYFAVGGALLVLFYAVLEMVHQIAPLPD